MSGGGRADLLMSKSYRWRLVSSSWCTSLSLYFSLFLSTFNNNSPTLGFSSSLFEKFPDKEPKQTTCVVEGVCASSSSLLFLLLLQRTFHHLFFPFPCVFRVLYFLSLPFFLGWLFGRESRVPDTKRAKRIELHCDICFVLFGSLVQFSRKPRLSGFFFSLIFIFFFFFSMGLIRFPQPDRWPPKPLCFWLDFVCSITTASAWIPEPRNDSPRVSGNARRMDIYIFRTQMTNKESPIELLNDDV